MSWSASVGSQTRETLNDAIDAVIPSPADLDEFMAAQFTVAKTAAKTVAAIIPGPQFAITMSGHANGVGDEAKPGYSNDFLTITVSQVTP